MAQIRERSSFDCIPGVEVVRIELARKRQEAEALEFLLSVSQEVERRRAKECGDKRRESGVALLGSSALKIVRQSKPATPPARRVERGGIPPNGTPSVGPLPFTMTDAEIARDLRVSPKTIRRMDEAGKIPAPVTLGARSLRWVRQKIVD